MTLVEWPAAAAVGAAVFAFLALVVAVVAAAYARGSRDATNRQATAAEAQVEIMRRQVDLMERQGSARGGAREVPYVSPWTLHHFRGDTYLLTNSGTSSEYDVHIELPGNTPGRGPFDHEQIDPRSSVKFMAIRTMASSSDEVTITWSREPSGKQLTWKTVLPRKS